ncbi:hypothetical protein B1H10_05660 [candidate division KSB1 bacterium 4484_188]|nr:MAG: hypothetical protein B1H10_05660 [candidate division KSB1 bacterium 4484_188]
MLSVLRAIIIFTLINFFSNTILLAQKDNEIKNNNDKEDITITFVLRAQAVATVYNPPLKLIERIVKESSLAKINVESGSDNGLNLEAYFVFKNMNSFINWQESKELKEIFNGLESIGIRSVKKSISVNKNPNANLFK